ncbi:MAG TPA: hypothetical protein VF552_14660 [Allosphingosinicella sp.]|jgi:hypothetical protein
MRTPLLALALLASIAAPVAAASAAERRSPEARLARAVEGRVEGEPTRCLNNLRFTSSRIIDGTAIVYEAGNTLWVNRPRGGAESLDQWDVLVTRQFSPQLCRGDVVRLYDSSSMIQTGAVFLGDFVPYRRAR